MAISKIAFIGTGVMGFSMASHLLDKGYALKVYNRTQDKALPLEKKGAVVCNSIQECVKDCDLVLSIVGFVNDVKEVWLGDSGALKFMQEGAIGVDMTTSTPALAKEIAKEGAKKGILIADAPVTGGDVGAYNGTLTVLFGGDEKLYETLKEVFASFSKTYVRFGDVGAGQLTKACNQIAIGAGMMALCEALAFSKATGLDSQKVLETLQGGAAGSFSMNSYGPRILKGDFKPGFYLKHFVKDLKIALDVAKEHNLNLEGTALALKLYEKLQDQGFGDLGTQALYKIYENRA